jgi:serine/threonine protein kinase
LFATTLQYRALLQIVFQGNVWDNCAAAKDLLVHLLEVNPDKRWTAEQAIHHPWFETTLFAL